MGMGFEWDWISVVMIYGVKRFAGPGLCDTMGWLLRHNKEK
jgi:hypothetical protein